MRLVTTTPLQTPAMTNLQRHGSITQSATRSAISSVIESVDEVQTLRKKALKNGLPSPNESDVDKILDYLEDGDKAKLEAIEKKLAQEFLNKTECILDKILNTKRSTPSKTRILAILSGFLTGAGVTLACLNTRHSTQQTPPQPPLVGKTIQAYIIKDEL